MSDKTAISNKQTYALAGIRISNELAVVEYYYTPDRLDAGYSLTISNGVMFTHNLARDGFRRSSVTEIATLAPDYGRLAA